MFNPDRLIIAREFRNLTQHELARAVFVSQGRIAKLEGGVGDPTDIIERLATNLNFPLPFFFEEGHRIGFGSSSLYYRRRQDISAAERRRISAIVNIARPSIERMLRSVEFSPERKLPFLELEECGTPQEAARIVRANWRLPDGPIRDVTTLIEGAGVFVIPCDFSCRAMDATSLRTNDGVPIIFVNRDLPSDRWRFTLCHELAHLVLHDRPTEQMEDEADAFASEFLVPEADVRCDFARLSQIRWRDLFNLKPYWKVSAAALLYRASSLGFVTTNQARYLWTQRNQLGYNKVEPEPLPAEKAGNINELFQYFRTQLSFKDEDFIALTNLPVDAWDSFTPVRTGAALRLVQ